MSTTLEENEGYLQFMAGKLGMIFSGDWMVKYYASGDSSVADICDVVEVPLMSTGKRASVIHGKANCISVATRIIPVTIQHPPVADLEAVVQKSVPIGVKTPALLHRDLALRPTDIADLPVSQVNQMRDGQFRSLVVVVFYVVNFIYGPLP